MKKNIIFWGTIITISGLLHADDSQMSKSILTVSSEASYKESMVKFAPIIKIVAIDSESKDDISLFNLKNGLKKLREDLMEVTQKDPQYTDMRQLEQQLEKNIRDVKVGAIDSYLQQWNFYRLHRMSERGNKVEDQLIKLVRKMEGFFFIEFTISA